MVGTYRTAIDDSPSSRTPVDGPEETTLEILEGSEIDNKEQVKTDETFHQAVETLSRSNRGEIQSLLGQGGQSYTFKGRWGPGRKPATIKVFKDRKSVENAREQRFYYSEEAGSATEPKKLQELGELIDWGSNHNTNWVATPYKEGKTLDDVVRENPPNEEDFKNIFYTLAEELQTIHDKGIVHRDLKPENVVYNENTNSAQPIDMGVAADVERLQDKDAEDSVQTAGSVMVNDWTLYPAFTQNPRPYDRVAEQHSLGSLMLYYANDGQHFAEYNPDTEEALTWFAENNDPLTDGDGLDEDRLDQALDECIENHTPSWFDKYSHIAKKTLCPDPDERYNDIGEVSEAIEEADETLLDKCKESWRTLATTAVIGTSLLVGAAGMMSNKGNDVETWSRNVGKVKSNFVNLEQVSASNRLKEVDAHDFSKCLPVKPGDKITIDYQPLVAEAFQDDPGRIIGDVYVEGFERHSFTEYPQTQTDRSNLGLSTLSSLAEMRSDQELKIPEKISPGSHNVAIELRTDEKMYEKEKKWGSAWHDLTFSNKTYSREEFSICVSEDTLKAQPKIEQAGPLRIKDWEDITRNDYLRHHWKIGGHEHTINGEYLTLPDTIKEDLVSDRYVSQITSVTPKGDTVGTFYVPIQVHESESGEYQLVERAKPKYSDQAKMQTLRQENYATE